MPREDLKELTRLAISWLPFPNSEWDLLARKELQRWLLLSPPGPQLLLQLLQLLLQLLPLTLDFTPSPSTQDTPHSPTMVRV